MAVTSPIYTRNNNQELDGVVAAFQALGPTSRFLAGMASSNILLSVASNQIQVFNSTAGVAYVGFGTIVNTAGSAGSAGTSTSDLPVGPGEVVIFTLPQPVTRAAATLAAGTQPGEVLFTPGIGV